MPRPPKNPTGDATSQPSSSSRFRVLSPEIAKARSNPSTSTPTPTSTASASASTESNPFDPSSNPQEPHPNTSSNSRPSLFSRFQKSYSSLPFPIRRTFRVLRFLVPAIPIGIFFSEHVFQVMWVRGPSMTPYLNEDYEQTHTKSDMVLVNMWPWGGVGLGFPWRERKRTLERGMVVTFRSPANPSHMAIKRVVGLPGDRITTRDPCMKPTQIVPFNHVWLEGDADNPKKSLDSNTYGPVSISLLTGRVMAVLWPRLRLLQWSDWENGGVEGDQNYRQDVRQRVLKEAVKMERPTLE